MCMAKKPAQATVSSKPLFSRMRERGAARDLAKVLNVSPQVVSNWKRRGELPFMWVAPVAYHLGMTADEYLRAAGYTAPNPPRVEEKAPRYSQYSIEATSLVEDYNALPQALQEYIARKAHDLRKYSDALPDFVRNSMRAPTDPDAYRSWERSIEADMLRLDPPGDDPLKGRNILTDPPRLSGHKKANKSH